MNRRISSSGQKPVLSRVSASPILLFRIISCVARSAVYQLSDERGLPDLLALNLRIEALVARCGRKANMITATKRSPYSWVGTRVFVRAREALHSHCLTERGDLEHLFLP
ncbi:cysteine-rich RLK (RECEPTOR-like protein kinase)23 [Striga asiatica]|uniref:Cysteine-rich RLK (RECEPTOR-like protein kinase)23 n=1 Tax=Striga asiatica TaxID=4170 RepID=A0A5A7PZP0_STRAF|nr:cysteine-rich RLK (RECEPTOR-like protein kinase)23 [Striga asiatica]